MFIDLRKEGYMSAHVVACPQCDCSYRIFYRYPNAGPGVAEKQERATRFAESINLAHPDHVAELIEQAS